MYENNLFIKDCIINDNTDWCSKQYICANSMWKWSVLAFTHIVIIYRCINAQVNGIIRIDGINGDNKKYLKQKMCMIDTVASNNERTRMNAD